MTRAAIRRVALPIVRELAGDAARRILDPCVRLAWWTLARRRWIRRGRSRLVRLANWRISRLWMRCSERGGDHCDGEAVARAVLREVEKHVPPMVG